MTSLGLLRWCDKIITFYVEKDLQDDSLFQKIVEVEVLCYSVTCSVKSVRAVRVRRMICTLLSRLGLHKHKVKNSRKVFYVQNEIQPNYAKKVYNHVFSVLFRQLNFT